MATCSKCKETIARKDPWLECKECHDVYHVKCLKITNKELKEAKAVDKWICEGCEDADDTEDEGGEEGTAPTKPTNVAGLALLLKDNFAKLSKEIRQLRRSQQFISDQYEDFKKMFDKLSELPSKVSALEAEMKRKDVIIQDLSDRIAKQEQYSRNCTFEIREVTRDEAEDVEDIVVKVSDALGVKVEKEEIQQAHRLPAKPGKTPTIIVQLLNRKKRDEIIACKTRLSMTAITGNNAHKNRIYIGESITGYYKDLLWNTKQWALTHNYKYTWFKKDSVMTRQAEGSKVIKIKNSKDLQNLIQNNTPKA